MTGARKLRARRARRIANALCDVLQHKRKDESQADSTKDTSSMNWNEYSRMKAIALCYIRRLVPLLAAYTLGYFSFSIAWLLLITLGIVVLKDHSVQQKLKTNVIRHTELKEPIKETSTESAEWLNQALAKLWPHVLHHIRYTMREEVEASIRASLNSYRLGGNFHFKKMHVGPRPLHLSNMEVLQESPPGEIVICTDIIYESNCVVTFVWRGIKGGMKDFQLRGRAHLVLRPLSNTIPFISGYHIIFPEKPDVQYKLSGVGYFLDIPGLREIVNHIITKRVLNLMAEASPTQFDCGPEYQMLIDTLERHNGTSEELNEATKYEDESLHSDQITNKQPHISDDEISNTSPMYNRPTSHISDQTDIKYKTVTEESVPDELLNADISEETDPVISTSTNHESLVSDVILRSHPSVSSASMQDCSSDVCRLDYNLIPKPKRTRLPI